MPMTRLEKQQRTARLNDAHQRYQDYNQGRDDASEYLSAAGHPLAAWYRVVATLFFKTRYCSNAAERVLASNASGSETIEIHSPVIREKNDRAWDIDGQYYASVYPAHPQYMEWVHAFARSGFKGSDAHLNCIFTTLTVKTNRDDVRDALHAFAGKNPWLKCSIRYDRALTLTFVRVNGKIPSSHGFGKAIRLLKTLFKDFWLPGLRPEDVNTLQDELPLAERAVMLGGGRDVVYKPRTILLPLWRLGHSADVQQHNQHVLKQIKTLLDNGYPWNAGIEQHLSHILKSQELMKLKKKYTTKINQRRA